MNKILTQEEINELLKSAQTAAAASPGAPKGRKYAPFIFGKASRISKQQVRDVAQIHESFAYNVKNRISAYLQVPVDVNPMSVDEVAFSEFTQSLPQQVYLASINVKPTQSMALMSLDLPVALSMIDVMLGGNGKPQTVERPATEIEERVLQTALTMICEDLQMAWRQVVEIGFTYDRSQRVSELPRLMAPYEKILFLSFEMRMPDVFSTLTLAFPAAVSSLLLSRLAKKNARAQAATSESKTHLRGLLKDCVFNVEMFLPPTRIRGKELLELRSGQTIITQHRVNQPATITVAGSLAFTGYPVKKGKQRGGMIHQKFPVPYPAERSNL